jgi:hypothetical protein
LKIDNLHLGYLLFFISGLTFTFVILAIEAGWDRLFIGLVLLFISGAILALIIFTKPNKSKKIQNEISEN